jgi:putative ATPase
MNMDMFQKQADEQQMQQAPLATRMRPNTLNGFVGQEHLVGKGRVLRRAIESDRIPSMMFWGPPGSGKTTLAHIIASSTGAFFAPVSAVSASVTDLRKIVADAKERRQISSRRTILFIDEIHRFSKNQQDAVLPYVEDGTVILIGATTENPSFEVTSPLLSRSRVLPLKPLSEDELKMLVMRAAKDKLQGLGELNVDIASDALNHLVKMSSSDARIALNNLEIAALSTPTDNAGRRIIKLETIEDAFQKRAVQYDRAGDQHYNLISALHKSMRDSDPDSSIYWLAMMLEAGEDPLYIARRMIRFASEDVGMADPQALVVAMAAQQAVHFIGMPEGNLALAEAAVYLATAPKSNSLYAAYSKVQEEINKKGASENVPLNIRNAPTQLMKDMGYGKDYKYAHDFPGHIVDQQHLPDAMQGKKFYEPGTLGFEKTVQERMKSRPTPKTEPEGEKGAGN